MKTKYLTVLGFLSSIAMSAHAGGIRCDDDSKCLPCVSGVVCHNTFQEDSDFTNQLLNDDVHEITGEELKSQGCHRSHDGWVCPGDRLGVDTL